MGNVLKQAQQRHIDLRSGRCGYNLGSFWDAVYSESANRLTNLRFDLSTANPYDLPLSKEEYRDALPNLRTITLTSEPNIPTLYNTTPRVLLAHAPHLTYLDISRVNRFDLLVIERLFPLLKDVTVRLQLDQLQLLCERNPSVFRTVSTLKLDVANDCRSTPASWRLLYEWASSDYMLALALYIPKWTASLQTVVSELCSSVRPHTYRATGLDAFSLHLKEIDHQVFEPNFAVWNCFISKNTKVQIFLKHVYQTTRPTVTWLDAMLNNFMKNQSDVLINMTLHCDTCDWKEIIDPLLVHYVEHVREAYLEANELEVIPTELINDCAKRTLLELKITLNVTNPIPSQNTKRKTRNPFTDDDLGCALFVQSRVSVTVHERREPEYEETPTKKQRIAEDQSDTP